MPIEPIAATPPVRVPEQNMQRLSDKFAALARRAEKLGLKPPCLVRCGEENVVLVHIRDDQWKEIPEAEVLPTDTVRYKKYILCRCEGDAPVIDGWSLISIIDHTTDPEIGNIIRNVPGMETPVEYRKSSPICQHCNSERRRHETFLLLKNGEYKQVGRNCLADFCRDPGAASQLIHSAEWFSQCEGLIADAAEEGDGPGCRGEYLLPLLRVLGVTRALIRVLGWMSRRTAEECMKTPTSSFVFSVLCDKNWASNASPEMIAAVDSLSDEDKLLAQSALDWIRGQRESADSLNDYMHNLLVVCSQERIPTKHFGLACSLIPTYMRQMEFEVERAARNERGAASEYFGEIKKRDTFPLTVLGMREYDSDYGVRTVVRLMDMNGNLAVWKTGPVDLKTGETYYVTGTVTEHSVFMNAKQTILKRCKYVVAESHPAVVR